MYESERLRKALRAVQEEVLRLLAVGALPLEVQRTLELIESICSQGHDVRTEFQRERTREAISESDEELIEEEEDDE